MWCWPDRTRGIVYGNSIDEHSFTILLLGEAALTTSTTKTDVA